MGLLSGLSKRKLSKLLVGTSADSKIGIWNWDIAGDRIDINRFWYDRLGYSKNIITNLKTLFTIVHPEEYEKLKESARIFLAPSKSQTNEIDIELRVKKSDGDWLWIFMNGTITKYKGTTPVEAGGIILDITAQKQIETELQITNSEIETLYEESEAQNEEMAAIMEELQRNHVELEEANSKLILSESKLRNIIDNSPIGIIQSRIDGSIISVNTAFCRAFGYASPEELLRERPSVKYFYQDKEIRDRIVKQLGNNNTYYAPDLTGIRKDGNFNYMNIYYLRLPDKFTNEDYLTTFIENITELKTSQLERNLFFNNSGDLMLIHTISGKIRQANSAWNNILGWEPDELKSMNIADILHPDDLEKTIEFGKQLQLNKTQMHITNRYRTKGGEYRIIQWVSIIFRDVNLVFSSGRDETERYEAEQELQKIWDRLDLALRGGTIGLWDFNLRDNSLIFNSNLVEILGFDRLENADIRWRDYIHEDDFHSSAKAMIDHIKGRNENYIDEYRLKMPDGSYKWFFSRGKIVERTNDGKPLRIAGSVTDITEQKEAEKRRLTLEHQMLQAQKLESLGLLAGGIAHDFNNLLTGILGNADMLSYELPEDLPLQQKLIEIQKAARRASELTHQMLAYSGKSTFSLDVIDINALVEEISSLLDISISKKVKILYSLEEDLPCITGNSTQLSQIVMNLILNASEAIENTGEIRITTSSAECSRELIGNLTLNRELAPGNYVLLEISDTGCGISPEKLKQIFDPFFTTKFTGRGLGLAAVSGIIRSHNAGLQVTSRINEGTTFRLYFPSSGHASKNQCVEEKNPIDMNKKNQTVLVADDEAYIRSLTSRMLKTAGFDVLLARNGFEVLNIFKEKQGEIACILLDLTMPELDGNEALIELRKINRDIPIIISSGYSEFDITTKFEAGSISGFLQKPYQFNDLLKAIDRALNKK